MIRPTRNTQTALSLLAIVAGMLMLSYASVPLYRLFCKYTGYGGTTQDATAAPEVILNRELTLRFNTDVMPGLPLAFKAEQAKMKLKIGEQKLAFFKVTNLSDEPQTAVSTFNVAPDAAGLYFMKIKCFCYDAQTIPPRETVTMPVSFFIDPSLQENEDLAELTTLTLSYTFFRSLEGK
jgi:cytochrome c oxidase assembly protein subunit 11